MSASQLRNWSPVYRQQAPDDRLGSIEDTQSGYKIVHTKDSQYHRIAVVEDDSTRYLRFDSSFQSGMYMDDPFKTRFEYTDYLQLPVAYRRETKKVLYVGLGGGSAPKRAWRDFPGMQIDVVELDPEVVSAAYKYFAMPRDPRLKVEAEDGRRFLARNEGPWDVIVVDAFYSDSIPFHLATREFLELVRSRLAPGGLVAANIIGAVKGRDSRLFRSMLRTYRAVFPTVNIHPVLEAGDKDLAAIRNIILVAGEGAAPSKEFLLERWRDVRRDSPGAPDLADAIRYRVDAPVSTADVPVLTDDYAPTDALLLLFGKLEGVPAGCVPLFRREAADHVPDELGDRAGMERFDEQPGHAELVHPFDDVWRGLSREDYERHVAGAVVVPQGSGDTEAVEYGYREVEQHDGRLLGEREL